MTEGSRYPACSDFSDVKPFFKKKGLFLKPLVRLNVTIQLPKSKSKEYNVSNHALMEEVRELARPDKFCSIKTTKTAVNLVRFEAELEEPRNLKWILSRIDGQTIKLRGHNESARARACVAKNDFPSRHDWDSFFRDSKHMNELKAGERPDTIHIQDLPTDWFTTKNSNGRPNEKLIARIFEQYGAISALDIPSNDPYRYQMKDHISGMKQFNFRSTNLFETYVQYKDYLSFVAAMDALRGMKLLRKEDDQGWTQVIKVDFDKTKHLSESSIRKRKLIREKLMDKERQTEEKCQEVVDNVVQTKPVSISEPIERRYPSDYESPPRYEPDDGADVSFKKILREEKIIVAAQRKLESIRLLSELLERVADKKSLNEGSRMDKRAQHKSIVSKVPQMSYSNKGAASDIDDDACSIASSASQAPFYNNRGGYNNWQGRGQPFMNQQGRGRFMRGRGNYQNNFNNFGNNTWGTYNNSPREGFNNQRGGFNNQSGGFNNQDGGFNNQGGGFNNQGGGFNNQRNFMNQRGGYNNRGFNNFRGGFNNFNNQGDGFKNQGFNQKGYGKYHDDRFFRRDQDVNNEFGNSSQYFRYFMSLARDGRDGSGSRSRSRSRSRRRSRSRSRSHRRRSRSRRRSYSRSRSRSRSDSRRRSKSRSRSSRTRSRSKSRTRRRTRSRSRSRSHSKSRRRSKSRSRSKSKGSSKSRSHSRTRRKSKSHSPSKNKSHSPSRSRKKTKSRSPSRSKRKSKSVSPSSSKRKGKSPSPSRSKGKDKSPSPSRSKGKDKSPSPSRSKRKDKSSSPSRSKKKSKSPSPSRSKRKSKSPSPSRSKTREKKSRTRSRSKSWGSGKHSRSRSRSWSQRRSPSFSESKDNTSKK